MSLMQNLGKLLVLTDLWSLEMRITEWGLALLLLLHTRRYEKYGGGVVFYTCQTGQGGWQCCLDLLLSHFLFRNSISYWLRSVKMFKYDYGFTYPFSVHIFMLHVFEASTFMTLLPPWWNDPIYPCKMSYFISGIPILKTISLILIYPQQLSYAYCSLKVSSPVLLLPIDLSFQLLLLTSNLKKFFNISSSADILPTDYSQLSFIQKRLYFTFIFEEFF